jgi:hypothetical protein
MASVVVIYFCRTNSLEFAENDDEIEVIGVAKTIESAFKWIKANYIGAKHVEEYGLLKAVLADGDNETTKYVRCLREEDDSEEDDKEWVICFRLEVIKVIGT